VDVQRVLLEALQAHGIDVLAWALAWARLLPTVLIVPAFGTRMLPASARAVLGLGLSFSLAPALADEVALGERGLVLAFAFELLRGLPFALSSAALLWAVMMAGGLIDDLRGNAGQPPAIFSEAPGPTGTLLGLFACVAFLQLGGGDRVLSALSEPAAAASAEPLLAAIRAAALHLVAALGVALGLAAPVLCAVVVWDVGSALIVRAANPAHLQSALSPVRALIVVWVLALSLEGLLTFASRWVSQPL
jgi:type III secretory pathway component EscT